MPLISELSSSLYKSLDDVQAKKTALDNAITAQSKATTDYNNAVNKALELRATLDEEINKIIPASLPSRVRISA